MVRGKEGDWLREGRKGKENERRGGQEGKEQSVGEMGGSRGEGERDA